MTLFAHLGRAEGSLVSAFEGNKVDSLFGVEDGYAAGECDGWPVGCKEGCNELSIECSMKGIAVGASVG